MIRCLQAVKWTVLINFGDSKTKKCVTGLFLFSLACYLLRYFQDVRSYQPNSTFYETPRNDPLDAAENREKKNQTGIERFERIPQKQKNTAVVNITIRNPEDIKTTDCKISIPFTINYTEIKQNAPCEATFCSSLEGNKRKIDSYNLSQSEKYMNQLLPKQKLEVITKGSGTSNIEIPVFVGGASSNHLKEALGLFRNFNEVVRPAYPTAKLYFYDLGLQTSEIKRVKSVCNCTMLPFPFDKFPPYVKHLFSYTWKPIIIKMMLQTYRFVMWMDAVTRFQTSDLDPLFIQAKQQGVMAKHGSHRLAAHIHEDTCIFLEEPPCLYRNLVEFQGGMLFFHSNNKLVYDYILIPWVKCALVEKCMKTIHPAEYKLLHCDSSKIYHSCHRYDQAILSLLLFRIFPNTYMEHHIDHKYIRFVKFKE